MWRFEHPWVLLVATLLIIIVAMVRLGRTDGIASGALDVSGNRQNWIRQLVWLLTIIGLACLALAWANPQKGVELVEQERAGIAIAHVLDTSDSMEALDFGSRQDALTRMQGAVEVLRTFVLARSGDLQSLVVFGDKVFTIVPLTADQSMIVDMLGQVQSGMAGGATALGDALILGVKRLQDAPLKSRILVLLSDGKNTAGQIDPTVAATYASENGIRVYTIGIGSGGTAPYKVDSLFGTRVQNMRVEMDEKTLRRVADKTGGRYFNARNISELEAVYTEIDQLEKTTYKQRVSVDYRSLYYPFLLLAIVLMLSALLLQVVPSRWVPVL